MNYINTTNNYKTFFLRKSSKIKFEILNKPVLQNLLILKQLTKLLKNQKIMILYNILFLLQNPITVLLLSSIASWVVLTQIWEPYQKKQETKQNLLAYQKEAILRLTALEMACAKKWSNSRIIDFLNGNVSVDRTLKDWKISYLVHSGWPDSVYKKTIITLTELEKLAQEDQYWLNEEKTKKSKQLLDSLILLLQNQKPTTIFKYDI